ncbi:MAG: hypothetical protein IJR42_04675 [Paludibacteraceae bacterium]|nr:hypothetical protein [Paludibacteraceae bacterium]
MLKRLIILLLLFLPVAGGAYAAQSYYVVTANTLNVRSGPGTYYSVAYKLHRGDTVVATGVSGQWTVIQRNGLRYYASNRYLRYVGPVTQKNQSSPRRKSTTWDSLFEVTKVIIWILVAIAVIGGFIGFETVAGLALWALIICGAGAFVGWMFFDNGTAGAVVTMGIEIGLVAVIVTSFSGFRFPRIAGFGYLIWALISLPFYILNLLQFWLSKPWRPLMKHNRLSDSMKPGMRTFLRILQIPFYIALTPLRFINAVYYNIVIYNLYAWSNYVIEVLLPSDDAEGASDFADWIIYLPKRIGKYWLWHGVLTTIESVVWTILDTIFPAVTLYHGTALEYADNMLCDPHRNDHRHRNRGWLTGIWNVGGGNYAGDGIYFGIFRKTLRNYEQGSAIATRVTMGKTIDTVLMPDYVYSQAGYPNAKAVSNWGLNNGYVCGEWWRSDRGTNWWEICMYDRQNRYNDSWRIRPIYAIHSNSGIMQRIPGGPAHWLFRKQVIRDIETSIDRLLS